MDFGFYLFSLLMAFMLVVVYFFNKNKFSSIDRVFRSMVLTTHIIQIFNIFIYIAIKNGNNVSLFGKFYLFMILLWFVLLLFFYLLFFIKEKYDEKDNRLKKIPFYLLVFCVGIQLIGGGSILLLPVSFINGVIDYGTHFINYFLYFCLGIEFLVLLVNINKVKNKVLYNFFFILIMQFLMVYFQVRGIEIPIFNVGIILITFYMYFMEENKEKKKLESLKLERDYAKRQSISKSEFLKVLSHEIRTPLNAIDGFSQVILDSDNIEEIKNDVADIRVASNDLIDVINGMIDLSIIESGNLEILAENYNVYDMFDNIVNITKSKIRDKDIEFKVSIDDKIPEVLLGDSERISQIILNLLTNSIKFTDTGFIELKVQSVRTSSKCRLKVIVTDTGRGIKQEDLRTIFEGKTNKEVVTLGLAISKHLVELMEGNIEVDSVFERGSTFTVTIDQVVVSERKVDKNIHEKVLKPFKATNKRILLVDDNKLNLKVVAKLLQPYDVSVVDVQSGKDCLDVLEKNHDFDLILMDDLMPEMSGTECLDILKKIERIDGYYIPVVVLTANAFGGVREKYLDSGFDDYLAKPIDKYELDRILKKYLKGKK